ncbi:MAG TPA: polyketide cyclase [Flavisolibacter sp.]
MKTILKDRSFRLSIILTFIFLSTGFLFLHYGLSNYGWVLFVLLPIVLGISIGALPGKRLAYAGLIISIIVFLIGLVTLGLEGFICVIMTLPIVLPLLFLGSIVTHLAKRYDKLKASESLPVLLLPLFVFLFGSPMERMVVTEKEKVVEVKSEIVFPYSNHQVYDAIKSVDTLIAEKTFLMKIDLPIPQKCVLEKEEVGGLRTCYFSGGKIVERITALEKGKTLKMDVINYQLTGRKWLGFREAIYLFDSVGINRCKMTRITTYTSALRPRFYWEPLERLGIEQEHEYVFRALANNLKSKYDR